MRYGEIQHYQNQLLLVRSPYWAGGIFPETMRTVWSLIFGMINCQRTKQKLAKEQITAEARTPVMNTPPDLR